MTAWAMQRASPCFECLYLATYFEVETPARALTARHIHASTGTYELCVQAATVTYGEGLL